MAAVTSSSGVVRGGRPRLARRAGSGVGFEASMALILARVIHFWSFDRKIWSSDQLMA